MGPVRHYQWEDRRSGRDGGDHPSRPGDEVTEDRAAGGRISTAAEKRGLYNLIVPTPTAPEMIRKEKRQDNDELVLY